MVGGAFAWPPSQPGSPKLPTDDIRMFGVVKSISHAARKVKSGAIHEEREEHEGVALGALVSAFGGVGGGKFAECVLFCSVLPFLIAERLAGRDDFGA